MQISSVNKADFDERIIPDKTPKGIISIHLARYEFARNHCEGKRVLDVACGVGYGSEYLSQFSEQVVGVDLSEEAVQYAQKRYQRDNIQFFAQDACKLQIEGGPFDVACSFETIEHLPSVEPYLKNIVNVLKDEGVYIVSSPYVSKTTLSPENPYHIQEWSPKDFELLLQNYFSEISLFGQQRKQSRFHQILQKLDFFKLRHKFNLLKWTNPVVKAVGTTPFSDMDISDFSFLENDFKRADYIIGICKKPKKVN